MGKSLNLDNPQTFNEKIQWLKLYYRRPECTMKADKWAVRKYIADTIGEEYLIPLVGGPWDSFDEIDFDKLPEQFVLKCTHDSGSVIICRDKKAFNVADAKKKTTKNLKRNFYWWSREWQYKDIPPQIIAEKYMVDESGYDLKDYKVFCFSGSPKIIQVDIDRFNNHKKNLYTTTWEFMNFSFGSCRNDLGTNVDKPARLNELLEIARKLSNGIPLVRVDFYSIKDKLYFGELTFTDGSGYNIFDPPEWDFKFGEWIDISEIAATKSTHNFL